MMGAAVSSSNKGSQKDIRDVARERGVHYVIEGSVRGAADTMRITAQLIAAESGAHVWADRFDGGVSDTLQDNVTEILSGPLPHPAQR
jgi:adenylate cyclase